MISHGCFTVHGCTGLVCDAYHAYDLIPYLPLNGIVQLLRHELQTHTRIHRFFITHFKLTFQGICTVLPPTKMQNPARARMQCTSVAHQTGWVCAPLSCLFDFRSGSKCPRNKPEPRQQEARRDTARQQSTSSLRIFHVRKIMLEARNFISVSLQYRGNQGLTCRLVCHT